METMEHNKGVQALKLSDNEITTIDNLVTKVNPIVITIISLIPHRGYLLLYCCLCLQFLHYIGYLY